MSVKEALAVKLLDVQDGGALQATAQSLLGATFVCNQRLKHRPHHIELQKERMQEGLTNIKTQSEKENSSTQVSASQSGLHIYIGGRYYYNILIRVKDATTRKETCKDLPGCKTCNYIKFKVKYWEKVKKKNAGS